MCINVNEINVAAGQNHFTNIFQALQRRQSNLELEHTKNQTTRLEIKNNENIHITSSESLCSHMKPNTVSKRGSLGK